MIRLAFLSTAHIHTKSFLERVAALDEVQCAAVWDDDADRGRGYADSAGAAFVNELDAVIGDDTLDGFVVCAENTRHLPVLEKALPAGKPVMCEKPLATTTGDARRIAALAQQHNTPLISGYFQPFSGANRAVKRMIDAGELGRVTHARFRNAHHAAYGRWFDKAELAWFTDPGLAGGGALMDMGTHAVHLLRHLVGPADRVWATTANVSGIYGTVDDYGTIEMQHTGGVRGRAEAAWCFTGGIGGLEVIGSERSIWNTADGLVVGGPGVKAEPVEPLDDRPTRVDRLVALIRGELDPQELQEDLAACLDAVSIMAAAYRSAESGAWQSVEPTVDGATS